MTSKDHGRPVIFGEVLFDQFEDGTAVLGGAPFNVAWHLQGFAAEPLFISRVGDDANGDEVTAAMRHWGMTTTGLQRDPSHPTGSVAVTLRDGQPAYTILDHQAYDYIDLASACNALGDGNWALLYHGSLALRSRLNAATLDGLRRAIRAPLFVDINLRSPWWSHDSLEPLLLHADWLKLNDEELGLLCRDQHFSERQCANQRESANSLRRRFGLRQLIVTRGASGAFVSSDDGIAHGQPVAVERLQDTVGAGDAFSAVWLFGLLRGWSTATTLQRALAFAAEICGRRGAIPQESSLYHDLLQQWQDEECR